MTACDRMIHVIQEAVVPMRETKETLDELTKFIDYLYIEDVLDMLDILKKNNIELAKILNNAIREGLGE